MDVKFVLQLLGIVYSAIGLALLFNTRYYKKMIDEYAKSLPVIFLNGSVVLIMSYLLIYIGRQETGNLPMLVTIFGWLGLLKGLYILLLPKSYAKFASKLQMRVIIFEAFCAAILGIIFLYFGFVK